jgi:transcriptional regulator with XRE-family HTH domain
MSETIGTRIKLYRIERGYSLSALARMASISRGYLHNIESGSNSNPGAEFIGKLAGCLGISTDTLLTGHDINADVTDQEYRLLYYWHHRKWPELLHMIGREMETDRRLDWTPESEAGNG